MRVSSRVRTLCNFAVCLGQADPPSVTGIDIAEEIVWAAARPPHVNIAEVFVLPVNQASATINYRPGLQK